MVFFLILCERSAKPDTGQILYYLTIELDYAKRDSSLLYLRTRNPKIRRMLCFEANILRSLSVSVLFYFSLA